MTFDEATGQFAVGETAVTIEQVMGYDFAGQIFWARDELRDWAREYASAVVPQGPAVVDIQGAWCPHCRSRNSVKRTSGFGCAFWVFVLVSMGLALIMIPFLPKTWHCFTCGNEWRA